MRRTTPETQKDKRPRDDPPSEEMTNTEMEALMESIVASEKMMNDEMEALMESIVPSETLTKMEALMKDTPRNEAIDGMDQPEQSAQIENTICVSKEDIHPIVTRSLRRISEFQWNLIAAGTPDGATLEALIDVVTDILQALSAGILRALTDIISERRAASTADREGFNVSLGDSMSASIAETLGLPESKSEDAERLTELVEREVSQRVNSAVSLAVSSPVMPSEPAIYVSASASRIGNVRRLVLQMSACLKRYAVELASCGRRDDSSGSDDSAVGRKSNISVKAATESIKGILHKWSSEDAQRVSPTPDYDYSPPTCPRGKKGGPDPRIWKDYSPVFAEDCSRPAWIAAWSEETLASANSFGPSPTTSPPSWITGWSKDTPASVDSIRDSPPTSPPACPRLGKDYHPTIVEDYSPPAWLNAWREETPDSVGSAEEFRPPSGNEFDKVASDIVRHIMNDLSYRESGSKVPSLEVSSKPRVNIGPIIRTITHFISPRASTSRDDAADNQKFRHRFFKTARMRFAKMGADLKKVFKKKHPEFLVDLDQRSDQPLLEPSVTLVSARKSESPVDFDSIEPDVENLFDMVAQSEEAGKPVGETLENIRLSEEVRHFSRNLTGKMYDHLMIGRTYQIPLVPPGRSLSCSILSKARKSQLWSSPEVLYAMTEDAVGKFLQNLLLSSSLDALPEEVSGALTDIEGLITKIVTPMEEEENIVEPEVPEASPVESPVPALAEASADSEESESYDKGPTARYGTPVEEFTSQPTDEPIAAPEPEERIMMGLEVPTAGKEHSPAESPADAPTASDDEPPTSKPSLPVVAPCSSESVAETTKPDTKTITPDFSARKSDKPCAVIILLVKAITASLQKPTSRVSVADFKAILDRLFELPLDDITTSAEAISRKMDRLSEAMVKDLEKVFGSTEKLLLAATNAEDPSFDEALLMVLKINLETIPRPDNLKSGAAGFFTAVGKVFTKAFRRHD